MDAVVLFATRGGNTKKVAEHIAQRIGADIIDLKENNNPDIADYDIVILGSGVYSGKPNRIGTFIKKNVEILSSKKVTLFFCCLYGGERGDAQLESLTSEWNFLSEKKYFHGKTGPDMSEVEAYIPILRTKIGL